MLKRVIHSLANKFGYTVARSGKPAQATRESAYSIALHSLLGFREKINIIQIGANDGRLNDPLYPFAMKFRDRTRLCLVEPQQQLIPFLQNNYQAHPSLKIKCAAVGLDTKVHMYAVKKAAWPAAQPRYADKWPLYRAPTGVTSSNRTHVENWLRRVSGKGPDWVNAMIEVLDVNCIEPATLLEEFGPHECVDVLQVDCEGMDERIVSWFLAEGARPYLINFEKSRIDHAESQKVSQEMAEIGYNFFDSGRDQLCILSATLP